jgi:hypothetical protein
MSLSMRRKSARSFAAFAGPALKRFDKIVEHRIHRAGARFKRKLITLRGGICDGGVQAF